MEETQYGKYTYNSSSFIRRTTHRLRLKKSLNTLNLNQNDCILDYGAGDGYLATLIYNLKHHNITCFEPMDTQYTQMLSLLSEFSDIKKTKNYLELSNNKYNKIFCLEVMEHLPEEQLNISLQEIYKLLDKNGKVLITVPCESGINGFLKNCIKKIVDRDSTYKYKELWQISFNKKKIERNIKHAETNPYIYEHFGFNNIQFEHYINANKFKIERKEHFPLKYLKIFSSQIFYTISK